MSIEATAWVLREGQTLIPEARLASLALADVADMSGNFAMSAADLCRWTRVSHEALSAAVRSLCSSGEILRYSVVDGSYVGTLSYARTLWTRDTAESATAKTSWEPRSVPRALRLEVLRRDGNQCLACGTYEALSIDHIVPISRGGTHDIENLQVLCMPCNQSKGRKTVSYR